MLKNLRNRLSDNKGFSLVELIVVIAIMVILIAILVPNITGYINKSRDVSAQAAAKTVYDAAYAYQTELLGKNFKIADMTADLYVTALTSDGSYKLDGYSTSNLKSDASIGEGEVGLTVDSATGKITTHWYSITDDSEHVKDYPEEESAS